MPEHDYGSRHGCVAPLIGAHRVALCETEQIGNALGVDQVLGLNHRSHDKKYTCVDKGAFLI